MRPIRNIAAAAPMIVIATATTSPAGQAEGIPVQVQRPRAFLNIQREASPRSRVIAMNTASHSQKSGLDLRDILREAESAIDELVNSAATPEERSRLLEQRIEANLAEIERLVAELDPDQ